VSDIRLRHGKHKLYSISTASKSANFGDLVKPKEENSDIKLITSNQLI
jgi:hypothetical protein